MKACYIHVPFCKNICAYCDFVRCGYQKQLADKWLSTICRDIESQLPKHLETIYIGGGTPSALNHAQLQMLLHSILPFAEEIQEYTIEANPDSLDDAKMRILQEGGVNRLSLGVQTFQPELQDILHRQHTLEDIQSILKGLHTYGIKNVSIDLMYGLPTQSMKQWKQDLQLAAELPIQHISLYALTIEENSEFGRTGVKNIDAQLEADMYEYAISFLQSHGFMQYEISNFAKPGYESKHNITYWKYEDFLGIGCGASGKIEHERYDNTANLHTYITKGAMPHKIFLSQEDEMFEMLMMSLRMKQGICLQEFEKRFSNILEEVYKEPLLKHIKQKHLQIDNGYLHTTYQGMLVLNDILVDFL